MYTIVSWDEHEINDGVNYMAILGEDAPYMAGAAAQSLERWQAWPVFAGKKLLEMRLPLLVFIQPGGTGSLDELKGWFNPGDISGLKRLVIEYGGRNWYVEGVVESVELLAPGAGVQVTLAIYDPVWKTVEKQQEVWDTSQSTQKTISVGGIVDAMPVLNISPISGSGYAYRRWVKIYNAVTSDLAQYPLSITLDTASLVSAGKCQNDGDDLRVWVDGVEVPRWLTRMNTSTTRIWIVLDLPARIEMTLETAIPPGTIGEIRLKDTAENKKALSRMPVAGIIEIDNEIFLYNGKSEKQLKLLGIQRAQRGSTAAAHSVGAVVRLIPHDIWVVYGNATIAAKEQDEAQKPLFDIASSSNTQWVWGASGDGYWDANQIRTGYWTPAVLSSTGKESRIYTASQSGEANPATVMGAEANVWYKAGKVQGETCTLVWTLSNPCGIGTLTSSGNKRRAGSSWPAVAGLQKSVNGATWVTLWSENSPGSESTWTAWSRWEVPIGVNNVRFALAGSLTGVAGNQADMEVSAVTLTIQNPPVISVMAEEAQAHLAITISNQATGEAIMLDVPAAAAGTMTIDTVEREVMVDGQNMLGAVSLDSVRQEWLRLVPGENDLSVSQACGIITISWRERMP
jgi:hypothetical protein